MNNKAKDQHIGEIVDFGMYGKKAIEWIVVAEKDELVMLVTKHAVFKAALDTKNHPESLYLYGSTRMSNSCETFRKSTLKSSLKQSSRSKKKTETPHVFLKAEELGSVKNLVIHERDFGAVWPLSYNQYEDISEKNPELSTCTDTEGNPCEFWLRNDGAMPWYGTCVGTDGKVHNQVYLYMDRGVRLGTVVKKDYFLKNLVFDYQIVDDIAIEEAKAA